MGRPHRVLLFSGSQGSLRRTLAPAAMWSELFSRSRQLPSIASRQKARRLGVTADANWSLFALAQTHSLQHESAVNYYCYLQWKIACCPDSNGFIITSQSQQPNSRDLSGHILIQLRFNSVMMNYLSFDVWFPILCITRPMCSINTKCPHTHYSFGTDLSFWPGATYKLDPDLIVFLI